MESTSYAHLALLQELTLNKTDVINTKVGTSNIAIGRPIILEKELCSENK